MFDTKAIFPKGLFGQPATQWMLWAVLLLYIFSLLFNLGAMPLHLEESRRAFIALELQYNQNWWVPTQLGERYYRKPPLFNWMLLVFFELFGTNEFSARLLTVLSLLTMGAVHFQITRIYLNPPVAFFSTALLLISVDFYFYFSMIAEIDLFYSMITYVAFLLLFHYYQKGNYWLMFIIPYTLHALGLLTKGLPSILFTGITTLAFLALTRKWRLLFSIQHITGSLVFLIIALGYFYIYSQYQSLESYFASLWSQSSERTLLQNGILKLLNHLFSFLLDTLKNILPAALIALPLFLQKKVKIQWQHPLIQFASVVFAANFIVYWFSPGARARYIYMLYPFLILILTHGYFQLKEYRTPGKKVLESIFGIAGVLFAMGMLVFPFLPMFEFLTEKWVIAILLFLSTSGYLVLYWKFPVNRLFNFILLFVFVRIFFDAAVIPLNARQPHLIESTTMAKEVVEWVPEDPLHLSPSLKEGSFPFQTVFYIERDRRQVLERKTQLNCTDFFLAGKKDLKLQKHRIYKEFQWRNTTFFLVKYEECQ